MYKIYLFFRGILSFWLWLIFLLLVPEFISAKAKKEETITIYYEINSAVIDTSFKENLKELHRFDRMLESQSIDTLFIMPSASPDGERLFNENLRKLRAMAIVDYVKAHYSRSSEICFIIQNAPIGWDVLVDVLHNDSTVNISRNVYCLLQDDNLTDIDKQRKLHSLGNMYEKITRQWLPELRYAKCILRYKETETNVLQYDTIEYTTSTEPQLNPLTDVSEAVTDTINCCREYSRWHISTNIAYWLALAHNVGVGYDLDDYSTVSLEGACAWWSNLSKHRVYRWMVAEAVYKRYFQHGIPRQGWFVGGYLQTGLFELMFSAKNRKGEFAGGGLSGGYVWNLSNRLSLSTELGLGCLFIKYRYAKDIDGTLIRQGCSTYNYYGPTRLAVSLTYNFLKKGKVK